MKKYEKVTKADYERWYRGNEEYRRRVSQDGCRLRYHLMPETGWLNDPNGLCQFHGIYHIYFQYTPFEPSGQIKLWGHYTTEDFIHYTDCGPVLFPDQDFDAHGVYSGSAFIEDDVIHYFYTGNVKYFDRNDYDYIMTGRGSNTIHCTSRDGVHFSPKELLMTNADYPADISAHVRDPKIIKKDGIYYMALGARDIHDKGMVLLYRSEDLKHWNSYSRITTGEPFGYMWECPDLFYLDGRLCLICCPQGVEPDGMDYWDAQQCTVMMLEYDFTPGQCSPDAIKDIRVVDRGFDFYAPQTFLDERGRRILIAWMGTAGTDYTNPTAAAGWQHALTLPRVLHVKNGRLIQQPVEELKNLRKNSSTCSLPCESGCRSGIIYEAELVFSICETMCAQLRNGVLLSYEAGMLTLDMGSAGSGRKRRYLKLNGLHSLRIFSDTTSLEIFVNGGEETFTTRVYDGVLPEGEIQLTINGICEGTLTLHELNGVSLGQDH